MVLSALGVALTAGLYLFTNRYQSYIVKGRSMEPTLSSGTRMLVRNLSRPTWADIERGDIVTYLREESDEATTLGRVVAGPGDSVEIAKGILRVNGAEVSEPYRKPVASEAPESEMRLRDNVQPLVVPPESVYILGDNREESSDARVWGPTPLSRVTGKHVLTWYSPGGAGR
ncbi:MAG: signal peptidase I [Planctomycetes bacterium]|nr:signal peptidase I [Planctomycetota bacterium]